MPGALWSDLAQIDVDRGSAPAIFQITFLNGDGSDTSGNPTPERLRVNGCSLA